MIGLIVAILFTYVPFPDDAKPMFYKTWAWMAFCLNSTMSVSILFRIRFVNMLSITIYEETVDTSIFRKLRDIRQRGLERYATVFRALIESAVLSWLATLSCAVAWSLRSACLPTSSGTDSTCFWVRCILASMFGNADHINDRLALFSSLILQRPSFLRRSFLLCRPFW